MNDAHASLVYLMLLGIEKDIGKANESIGSKGFTRGSQEVRNRAPCGRPVPSCDLTCPWERFGINFANTRTTTRELREAHKRTEARLNDLTELLHKFATQMAVNSQPSSSSNPLPSQPLPNPKGGINMVQTTSDNDAIVEEEDDEEEEDEEDDDWLYDLLAKLAGIDSDSEDEYDDDEEEEMTE
ncbi:hypothetical protein PIB30_093652 [Stylosanthes scabra]|uniref:Uncharacterized protein n=1 Tax=Stylosanthes scabra TaxID=79078 RepID=A0ABU6TY75_9FABA|nr:hypothetical protein [Stylosanthes scabra]